MQKHYVRTLFDSIAYRYDLVNHLLSGGIDLYWRRRAIHHLDSLQPGAILDVATGTADFALAALRLRPDRIVGVDIAEEMLRHGRMKIAQRDAAAVITLTTGDAEHLAFTDASFDAAIVAFGVRNFEDLRTGLGEMYRVLRPGGKIVVLEFSRPARFPFRQLYLFYFLTVLPLIGRIISRNAEAYRYLPDTVMAFPDGAAFMEILTETGFTAVSQERLTFGIATVYTGGKPAR